jgi:signal transduction histidine kinase
VAALEDVVHELRRLAHGVRPSRLDDGLSAAIHHLVRDSAIPIDVHAGEMAVTDAVATTAYFVVAESLANTLKHARASRARVTLAPSGARLIVEVTDDGCGGAQTGSGLTALCDRVTALGGRFELVSPPGGGTTIRAEL